MGGPGVILGSSDMSQVIGIGGDGTLQGGAGVIVRSSNESVVEEPNYLPDSPVLVSAQLVNEEVVENVSDVCIYYIIVHMCLCRLYILVSNKI